MTWWSPTTCHVQRVMILINSYGLGMYFLVLIEILTLCLKMLFYLKKRQVFLTHPVYIYMYIHTG